MDKFEVLPDPPQKECYESPVVLHLGPLNTLIRGTGSPTKFDILSSTEACTPGDLLEDTAFQC
jgi:hypothetical protein